MAPGETWRAASRPSRPSWATGGKALTALAAETGLPRKALYARLMTRPAPAPLRGGAGGRVSGSVRPGAGKRRPAWALRRRPRLRPSPSPGGPRFVAGGASCARLRAGHRFFGARRFRGGGGAAGAPAAGASAAAPACASVAELARELDPPRRRRRPREAGVARSSAGEAPWGLLAGASASGASAPGRGRGGATAADRGSSAGGGGAASTSGRATGESGAGGRRRGDVCGGVAQDGREAPQALPGQNHGGPALRLHRLPRGAGHRRRGLRRRERAVRRGVVRRWRRDWHRLRQRWLARRGHVRLRLGHGDQALDGLGVDGLVRVRRRHLGLGDLVRVRGARRAGGDLAAARRRPPRRRRRRGAGLASL